MPTVLFPNTVASSLEDENPSDNSGNGIGGGRFDDPGNEPHENSEPNPDRWATPLSAYRVATLVGMVWILTLFAALTGVLESLRAHSTNWGSIPLPHSLYLNTAALVISSSTIEFARFSLRAKAIERCARWLFVTILLGLAFLSGQIITWRDLVSRGFHLASNAGSFCFYLITAAHALHLVGGLIGLCFLTFVVNRLGQKGRSTAVGLVLLYWHFMAGLWLYVLTVFLISVQR